MKTLRAFFWTLCMFLGIYAAGSLYATSFDIHNWPEGERGVVAVFGFGLCLATFLICRFANTAKAIAEGPHAFPCED